MKHLLYAVAAAGAVTLSANIADAATFTYNVYDHSDGNRADAPDNMDYGLRLSGLFADGNTNRAAYWSFEDVDDGTTHVRNTSLAQLEVDLMLGTASLQGSMRHNLDNSLWTIDVAYDGVIAIDGAGSTTSFGATTMTGTLSNFDSSVEYNIVGKTKPNGVFDFTLAFSDGLIEGNGSTRTVDYRVGDLLESSTGAGWVSSINGNMLSGTNDFLYTVELTTAPLPATAWFLIAGLGGLGAMRRFKKA